MRSVASWRSLYVQVLIAIAVGILLGTCWPHFAQQLKPLGDGFIKLIRLLIAPIIFCTVVTGIAGVAKLRDVGKAGGLALLYFEVVSTIALLIGLVVVNVLKPGVGVNADAASLDAHAVAQYAGPAGMPGVTDFILNIIPTTFFGAFASGDVLQTLLLAILFGFALHAAGGKASPVYELVEEAGQVLFIIVRFVMRLAPLGALGAMAFTVGRYGAESLLSLARLMGCFYLTCALFVLVVLGLIARLHGFSIFAFIRYIREELFIVLGTSSSESVLPRMLQQARAARGGQASRRARHPGGLLLQSRRHVHLPHHGGPLHRAGHQHSAGPVAPADPACRAAAHLQGRGGRDRQRLHRARRLALGGRSRAGGGAGAHFRHRPLHVRGARPYQSHRQRRRHHRDRQVVQQR